MTTHNVAASRRLTALLSPLHDQPLTTARAATPKATDLFQDAMLRAFDRLDDLRDESR